MGLNTRKCKLPSGIVCVMPGRFPANISVAPNSPIALAQVIIVPEVIARIARGNETVKKTLRRESDNIFALLTISLIHVFKSCFCGPQKKRRCHKRFSNDNGYCIARDNKPKHIQQGTQESFWRKSIKQSNTCNRRWQNNR